MFKIEKPQKSIGLTQDQLLKLGMILDNIYNGVYAIWYDKTAYTPTVYVATGDNNSGGPYSVIVDLLQGLCGMNLKDRLKNGEIFVGANTAITGKCRGMMSFIGVFLGTMQYDVDVMKETRPKMGILYGYGTEKLKLINEWKKEFKVSEIDGKAMRNRVELTKFSGFKTGDDPKIDMLDESKEGKGQTVHRLYMMAAFALATHVGFKSYPIAAVLVSESGVILAWGVNTSYSNYTFHAEVNTLQSYCRFTGEKYLPKNSRLYTTLKPCKMCAGMIAGMIVENAGFKVFYAQVDEGSHACSTALDGMMGVQERLGKNKNAPKPIRLFKNEKYVKYDYKNTVAGDFGSYLNSNSEHGKVVKSLKKLLNDEGALNVKKTILRKYDKYAQDRSVKAEDKIEPPKVNASVVAVLLHLQPFLAGIGIDFVGKFFGYGLVSEISLKRKIEVLGDEPKSDAFKIVNPKDVKIPKSNELDDDWWNDIDVDAIVEKHLKDKENTQ